MENRKHFILSNRKVIENSGKLYLLPDHKIEPNNQLHYLLREFEPAARVNENTGLHEPVIPLSEAFVNTVLSETEALPDNARNVTLYIHGFHHIVNNSFKLDLMSNLTDVYCNSDKRIVGKFIFFSWPATQARNTADDAAHAQGIYFAKQAAAIFKKLHEELNKKGIQFNLMAHSFGHRILNGFLSELTNETSKYFDQVLLFASDIPHKALDVTNGGIILKNLKNGVYDGDTPQDDESRLYNLTPLQKLAEKVHVFHCRYDKTLMSSTAGEVNQYPEHTTWLVQNYLCLGNMGNQDLDPIENANFYDVTGWIRKEKETFGDIIEPGSKDVKKIDKVISEYKIGELFPLFNLLEPIREPWVNLHRYVYLCKEVTATVSTILRTDNGTNDTLPVNV